MKPKSRFPRRHPRSAARRGLVAVLALLLISGLWLAPQAAGDDRELLRENGADPYLFILLDSSLSMSLAIDDSFVDAGADDPRSRLYQAKEALYELLSAYDNIRFGFATFNQDKLHINAKHWLYYVIDSEDNRDAIADLGIGYPLLEPNNEIELTDGTIDIDGDMMVFGREFPFPGGTCDAPLRLDDADDRRKANRYSKLGAWSEHPTEIWVQLRNNGPVYRVTFENDDNNSPVPASAKLGVSTLDVEVTVEEVDTSTCANSTPTFTSSVSRDLDLGLWREFLMTDDSDPSVVFQSGGKPNEPEETAGGAWEWRDPEGNFVCGDAKPFSGGGWEGNYDTGLPYSTNPSFEDGLDGTPLQASTTVDSHCLNPSENKGCDLLLFPTEYDTTLNRRELDRGDMLPFHWNHRNKEEFLSRLNPNRLVNGSNPQYGPSFYFENEPTCTNANARTNQDFSTCRYRLKSPYRGVNPGDPPRFSPILAGGQSPISDAILDFRCWYTGDGSKCGRGNLGSLYTKGFQQLLFENNAEAARCRQPFLIVITDMENVCPGSSQVSQVAGMNTETRDGNLTASGVSTWVLNVGSVKVTGFTNAGKGAEIKVNSNQELRDTLEVILGIIQETARSFASAAVPSVQADVEDKIYVTQFTPYNSAAVWEGRVLGFLKPLPTEPIDPNNPDLGSRPDVTHPNFLWDAGTELEKQAPKIGDADLSTDVDGDGDPTNDNDDYTLPLDRTALRIGNSLTQRRLFFAIEDSQPLVDTDGDLVTDNDVDVSVPRKLFALGPAQGGNPPSLMNLNQVRKDMWRGLGVVDDSFTFLNLPNDPNDLLAKHPNETRLAHRIFAKTYSIKTVQPREGGATVDYLLGDIFHARPELVGSPSNGRYLARPDDFPGYEDYFEEQQRRRKVLLVASNDGQIHAFDAGRFVGDLDTGEFENGTGVELFAFTPRVVLPALNRLATPPSAHEWGVDSNPATADVRIDPLHSGANSLADGPKEADRQWRTVVIGGMRRGGRGYYALDVSRPDPMEAVTENIAGTPVVVGYKPQGGVSTLPGCFTSNGNPTTTPGDCDPASINYPAVLWEFTDIDLGQTWSSPDMGAIRVIDPTLPITAENPDQLGTRYVAIFGGGLDPNAILSSADANTIIGEHLYMVDIETGQILYKRRLEDSRIPGVYGSTASAPAAVDTNQDGFIDRIYIGTTAGLMFRVDVGEPLTLQNAAACQAFGIDTVGQCIDPTLTARDEWAPYAVFDTATDEVDADNNPLTDVRKPIFFPPSVIFSSQLGRYALAFGTGNREDLWAPSVPGGNRFYLFVDDSDVLALAAPPRRQTDFTEVTSPVGVEQDLLQDPSDGSRGWFIRLGAISAADTSVNVDSEKLLAQPTAISGVNVFSTFVPDISTTTIGNGNDAEVRCARRGISRVYSQFTSNGDPVADLDKDSNNDGTPDATTDRAPDEVSTLVSEPFIEQADDPCTGIGNATDILKERLFPPSCRFASYRWNLSAMRADTGVECLAQIPVCIIEKNWRDR